MYNNVMIISEVPAVSAALNLIYFCHKKGVVDKFIVGTNYSRSLLLLGLLILPLPQASCSLCCMDLFGWQYQGVRDHSITPW